MSGLCRDCKHWNNLRPQRPGEGDDWDFVGFENDYRREMKLSPVPDGFGVCERTGSYGQKGLASLGSKAKALDGEQYNAILATAPDFGCVQFEAK